MLRLIRLIAISTGFTGFVTGLIAISTGFTGF